MVNVTFGNLVGIPKYRKEMREMIKHVSKKSDIESESKEEDIRKKPKPKKVNQMERVHSQPTFRIYGKVKRQNLQMIMDIGAELTVCTKSLAKKLGINYIKGKIIDLITIDGKKNKTCGVVEKAMIKIADAAIPMNIHIAE